MEYRIENLEFSLSGIINEIVQLSIAFNILSPKCYILNSTSNILNP